MTRQEVPPLHRDDRDLDLGNVRPHYTNVFAIEHIRFSEQRLYMALLMGSAMAIVMLGYMWGIREPASQRHHRHRCPGPRRCRLPPLPIADLVGDGNYMRGMIPHHSIAILTSERAGIEDLRVRELADEIIAAQRREIAEMDWLIADIEANGPAITEAEAQERPAPSFSARRVGGGAGHMPMASTARETRNTSAPGFAGARNPQERTMMALPLSTGGAP